MITKLQRTKKNMSSQNMLAPTCWSVPNDTQTAAHIKKQMHRSNIRKDTTLLCARVYKKKKPSHTFSYTVNTTTRSDILCLCQSKML